jgi:hypothetical protein
MKRIMISCLALAALAAPAFAGSTIAVKDGGAPVPTVEFKNFGQANAQYTGNGAAVGGNGNTDIFGAHYDQTTEPQSRSMAVQDALSLFGKGNNK